MRPHALMLVLGAGGELLVARLRALHLARRGEGSSSICLIDLDYFKRIDGGMDLRRLTFSAGIAAWPQDGSDLSSLLRRADVRLRQANLDGQNRVHARDT